MTRVHTSLGLAAVALFAAAANLRPAIAAVSPLTDRIRADLELSAIGMSLLTTIPTLAMGLCAPLGAYVGRTWGLQRGVLFGLAVIALATAARAAGPATWLQLGSAAIVGAGIAVAQTLLPAVVKTRFAGRAGLVTGIYTAGLGLGGAVAAGVSAPLAEFFGSWPGALASWTVLAMAGMAAWAAAGKTLALSDITAPAGPTTNGLPWRSASAWRITMLSAANSALYYCELAWIAPLLHEDGGLDTTASGIALTVMISIQVVAMLAVPALLGEQRDKRIGLTLTMTLTAAGFLGLALAPGTATWLWITALGVGHGGLFTLVLTLPVVISRDPGEASQISAMAFVIGYASAALAPTMVGALRDTTGNFTLAFIAMSALGLIALLPIARLHTPARSAPQPINSALAVRSSESRAE